MAKIRASFMDIAEFGTALKRQVAFYQKEMGRRAKVRKH